MKRHGAKLGPHTPGAALIRHITASEAWSRWFDAAGVASTPLGAGPWHELMSMAMNAALVGLGVALLPDYMTHDAPASGRLRRLSAARSEVDQGYWLVLPPSAASKPSVLAFRAWLIRQTAVT